MFFIGWLTKRRLALPLWGHGVAMALGVFLFSTNFALFYYASQSLASGLLAVVFASASLVNLFYGAVLFRTPIRWLGLLAAVLGFGGILAAVLAGNRELRAGQSGLWRYACAARLASAPAT